MVIIGEIKVCIFKTEPSHLYCGVYGKGSRVDSYSTDAGSIPASAQVFGWFRVNKISAAMRIKHIGEKPIIFLYAAVFDSLTENQYRAYSSFSTELIGAWMVG